MNLSPNNPWYALQLLSCLLKRVNTIRGGSKGGVPVPGMHTPLGFVNFSLIKQTVTSLSCILSYYLHVCNSNVMISKSDQHTPIKFSALPVVWGCIRPWQYTS